MARRNQALREDYYDYDYDIQPNSKTRSIREERVNSDNYKSNVNTNHYNSSRVQADNYNSRINIDKYKNRVQPPQTDKYYDEYDDYVEQEYIDDQDRDESYASTTINNYYQSYKDYDDEEDEDNNIVTILLALLSGVIVLAIILFLARSPIFTPKEDVPLAVPTSNKIYDVKPDEVYEEEIPYYKEEIEIDEPVGITKEEKAVSYEDKVNITKTEDKVNITKIEDNLVKEERTVVPKTTRTQVSSSRSSVSRDSSNKVSTQAPVRVERSNKVEKIERIVPVTPIYQDVDAYWIQVASFSTLEMARETKDNLDRKGFISSIEPKKGTNGIIYGLKVGSWTSETEANKFLNGIRAINGLDKAKLVKVKSKKRVN